MIEATDNFSRGVVESTLTALHPRGPWVIGVLTDGMPARAFSDLNAAVEYAAAADALDSTIGIYANLQRVFSAFNAPTLTHEGVEYFTNFLIDIDRPEDQCKAMTDDAEISQLYLAAKRVKKILADELNARIVSEACTGNGYRLLYRLHEPLAAADAANRALFGCALNGIADRCDPLIKEFGAQIDRQVKNPARWTRLISTVNRKFPPSAQRPWRRSYSIYTATEAEATPLPADFLTRASAWYRRPAAADADFALTLRDGVTAEHFIDALRAAGLVWEELDWCHPARALGYHRKYGKCLLKGETHRHGTAAACQFVVDPEKRTVYHSCFSERCRALKHKTRTALRNLGVDVDALVEAPVTRDFSDQAMVAAFAQETQDVCRFLDDERSWWEFGGGVWNERPGGPIYACGEFLKRQEPTGNTSTALHYRINSEKLVRSVLNLAKGQPALRFKARDFNPDPWVLGLPNGLKLNLKTGEVMSARPSDFLTKTLPVAPSETVDCPRWLRYLAETHPDDPQLLAYLKRLVGYFLTASVREEQLTCLIGKAGAGKGTMIEVLNALLGPYYVQLPLVALLEESNEDRRQNYIATLCGARLAVCNEGSKLKRLDSRTLKDLTGGGEQSGRRLGHQPITFTQTQKVVLVANDPPVLDVDEPMKQRVHVVSFNVIFRGTERDDKNLKEILKQNEIGGILRWAIEGCLEWQDSGLQPPSAVITRTREYFSEIDLLEQFLSERTTEFPDAFTATDALFASWRSFCIDAGDKAAVGHQRTFVQGLKEKRPQLAHDRPRGKGFTGGSGFHGIKLRAFQSDFGPLHEY